MAPYECRIALMGESAKGQRICTPKGFGGVANNSARNSLLQKDASAFARWGLAAALHATLDVVLIAGFND
eukprot:5379104-Pleurochrysis_carterae.AAC.4